MGQPASLTDEARNAALAGDQRPVGFYRFYNAGKFDGRGEDHIMFCFYGRNRAPGQCLLVPASKAAAEREAIIRNGWQPLDSARTDVAQGN